MCIIEFALNTNKVIWIEQSELVYNCSKTYVTYCFILYRPSPSFFLNHVSCTPSSIEVTEIL